jgi:hypothetical protein
MAEEKNGFNVYCFKIMKMLWRLNKHKIRLINFALDVLEFFALS